jgi:hypothetical protein
MFCLNSKLTNEFIKRLKSGEIDPEKMSKMSSEERRAFLGEFLGVRNAKEVNAAFESKLLLKDQQQAMINWAKQTAGLKPEARRDIISRVEKMTEILNPESEKAFLEDLAAHKLGVTVSMNEAAKISELAKETSEAKGKIEPDSPIQSPARMAYGRALVEFGDYVSELKNAAKKLVLEDFKNAPLKTTGKVLSNFAGLAKSLKATLDDSVIGRQGLKVLFTHPGTWLKNSAQTFVDIANTFGGKEVMKEVQADVLSRPNALNGLYFKEKLAIGIVEEAYPTSAPEKIPFLGRIFKASETAFTAFQYRTRADIFDKYVEIAQKSGQDDIHGIGLLSNSLTGRGTFGQRLESLATATNNVFFSPRYLKSHIDLLTMHGFDNISPFAKRQAAINLVKVISGLAAVLAIADQVFPGSVEKDPRSADFGKIRIGDTRFDVTAGMSSLAILAARLISSSTKSSVTGQIKKLNSGKFGSQTSSDLIFNFFENKLSPAASIVKDILDGEDFHHHKITPLGELNNLLTPLPITTYEELKDDPNSANVLIAMIADELGISTNTYSKNKHKG